MRILLALALPLAVRRTAARPCMCHVVACMLGCTPHSWRILLALARLVPVRTTAAFATAQANGGQVASCNAPSRKPQSTRARTNARQVACWNAQGPQKRGPKTGATRRYQNRAKSTSDSTLRHSKTDGFWCHGAVPLLGPAKRPGGAPILEHLAAANAAVGTAAEPSPAAVGTAAAQPSSRRHSSRAQPSTAQPSSPAQSSDLEAPCQVILHVHVQSPRASRRTHACAHLCKCRAGVTQ